ncbi:MAG: hypothetical protein HYR76_06030 [Ignavibacteria bacterium]|nr:hypothetical protein [Ignavibacteria bacterium]
MIAIIGCSHSSKETTKADSVSPSRFLQEEPSVSNDVPSAERSPIDHAKLWNPRFIQTGATSGIMIEFTGVKKNKPLRARFSTIELWRYPLNTLRMQEYSASGFTAKNNRSNLHSKDTSGVITLSTTINDLRQAFFKVAPGKYLLHQTKEWADQSYIKDVNVLEGNYSILQIDVFTPWLAKTKQLSESVDDK